jgi:HEAT repeats
MTLLIGFIIALGLMAPAHTATAAPDGGRPGELFIQREQDLLTVKARQIPHRRILEGLASQLHFELIIAGPLEEQRSLEIEARPWEEALKKALSPVSWAFVYDSSSGQPRLAKVFVFPAKEDGITAARPSSTTTRAASPPQAPPPTPEPQVNAPPQPQDKGIDPSLTELLEADDEEMRALALVGLATMGGEQAVTALRQALKDKEPWIRETAVEALAEIGGAQAIQGLQQALGDENEEVRKAAEEALTRLQPPPSEPPSQQ